MIDDAYTPDMLCGQCGVVLPCHAHPVASEGRAVPVPPTLVGQYCPACGHETVTSSVSMEDFEQICHERDELQAELAAVRAAHAPQAPSPQKTEQ